MINKKKGLNDIVKIDIEMPNNCNRCFMCEVAVDSELFINGERYCGLVMESVDENADISRASFCKLINADC